MIVLLAEHTGVRVPRHYAHGWGRMWVFRRPQPLPHEPTAFDNGRFTQWRKGLPFDEDGYRRRRDRAHAEFERAAVVPFCVVLPDEPGDSGRSLDVSAAWLDRGEFPAHWPLYLPVQDGCTPEALAPFVGRVAGLFMGGTDAYKATAPQWAAWAHGHGMQFHFGRAGTAKKVRFAALSGANSLDSAVPLWSLANYRVFRAQLCRGVQLPMFPEAA